MVEKLENTALADRNSADFYATLPSRDKSLLCCVCHEHNTTFRYEVIYKSGPHLSSGEKPLKNSSETSVVQQQVTLTTSLEDSENNSVAPIYT